MKEISFELKVPEFKFSRQRKFQIKGVLSLLIILGAFFARQNFEYTLAGTLILAYFGISLLWNIPSRIAAFCALLCLACCPVLLIFKSNVLAEDFAVYAFYFLVITVFQEVIFLARKSKIARK